MKKHLFLLFALVASTTFSHAAIINGTCGENLTWSLNTKDSTLTIEGSGAMTPSPWDEHNSYIAYVSLPDGLTSIGDNAFSNCSGLTSVTIPNSVTSIERNAFRACTGLTEVHISDITAWCNIKFDNYSSNPLCFAQHLHINDSEIKNLMIPNSVTSIGDYAFCNCTGLTSVTIQNSVTSIGRSAFELCTGLTSLEIPNSVTSIGSLAFQDCTGLTSVNIPNSVTSIGKQAFCRCSALTSIEIPNSVTKIEDGYDESYSGIYGVFSECTGLTSVTIPNSVTSIGSYAFHNCTSLTSVTIPSSVASIGNCSFSGCNLSSITCEATTPPAISNNTFSSYSAILFVPAESIETYQNTLYWEDFTDIRAIGSAPLVQFLDWNGTILSSANVTIGTAATPPAAPTRTGYTFTGWDKDFSNITEDLTVTALYNINRYEVKFVDWDGTILKSYIVDWNTAAVAPANPSREGYTFIGWDKEFSNVVANLIITAQYDFGENKNYTINFNTKDGDEILSNNIVLKVPAAPQINGFTFIGWRPVADIIEGNTIDIEAVYKADEPSSAPAVFTNPSNPAQKLIRNGNVYILTGDRIYTVTGQQVK